MQRMRLTRSHLQTSQVAAYDSLNPPPSSPTPISSKAASPVQSESDTEVPLHGFRANRPRTPLGKLLDEGVDVEESRYNESKPSKTTAARRSGRERGDGRGGSTATTGCRGGQKRHASVNIIYDLSKKGRQGAGV